MLLTSTLTRATSAHRDHLIRSIVAFSLVVGCLALLMRGEAGLRFPRATRWATMINWVRLGTLGSCGGAQIAPRPNRSSARHMAALEGFLPPSWACSSGG